MNSDEMLRGWRAEITAELEQLEAEDAGAEREFAEADSRYQAAVAEWSELEARIANTPSGQGGVDTSLRDRLLSEREEALRSHQSKRGSANGRRRGLKARIEGRRLSLRQIDQALTHERAGIVVEHVKRREPPIIDWSPIEMPAEAQNGAQ